MADHDRLRVERLDDPRVVVDDVGDAVAGDGFRVTASLPDRCTGAGPAGRSRRITGGAETLDPRRPGIGVQPEAVHEHHRALCGRRLARRVVVEGWTLTAAASAAGVSVRCARKWVGRYRIAGEAGLVDRSSAPRRVANRTDQERVAVIVKLRGLRMTAAEIAETLQMPLSTVAGILTRIGMGRLCRIGLAQPVRYERSRPGELVHVDIKKLGCIRGVGHRISGN